MGADFFNPVKLYKALLYSLTGLKVAFVKERAFQQEIALTVLLTPFALYLGHTGVERALLIGSLFFVLVVELINTAVETLVERISSEWNELSGYAKDIGSASVMLSIVMAGLTWFLILIG